MASAEVEMRDEGETEPSSKGGQLSAFLKQKRTRVGAAILLSIVLFGLAVIAMGGLVTSTTALVDVDVVEVEEGNVTVTRGRKSGKKVEGKARKLERAQVVREKNEKNRRKKPRGKVDRLPPLPHIEKPCLYKQTGCVNLEYAKKNFYPGLGVEEDNKILVLPSIPSRDYFLETFADNGVPVIIRRCARVTTMENGKKTAVNWNEKDFLRIYEGDTFPVSQDGNGFRNATKWTLDEYFAYRSKPEGERDPPGLYCRHVTAKQAPPPAKGVDNRPPVPKEERGTPFSEGVYRSMFEPGRGCLLPSMSAVSMRPNGIMFGVKDSYSSIHFDHTSNVFLMQGEGKKVWSLVPHKFEKEVCLQNENQQRKCNNLLTKEERAEVPDTIRKHTLSGYTLPGDVLYLPQGWLHATRCEADCIGTVHGLQMLNDACPNC